MKKGKKISGGKYIKRRKKKLFELPGQKRIVKLGEKKKKSKRTKGGRRKSFLRQINEINVQVKGKSKKARIKNVLETPSNRFLARQNIITKGTILETDLGRVRVTNRPAQESVLNGVILE